MELLKLPAGRLATVFYKAEPESFTSRRPLDSEKGSVDDDTPPITREVTQGSRRSKVLLGDRAHTFAWKDVCLDIKTSEGGKRLLDHLDGKSGAATVILHQDSDT